MNHFLKTTLIAQILTGGWWTFVVVTTPGRGDFGLLGLLVVVFAVQAVGFVVALISAWRFPQLRRSAAAGLALPFLCLVLPNLIRNLAGGHLVRGSVIAASIAVGGLLLLASFVFPRRAADWVPRFLIRSRTFNTLILFGVLTGWILIAVSLIWIGGDAAGHYRGDTGYGLALGIILAATYLVGFGVASFLTAAWASLCLRGGIEHDCRYLNVAQIVLAVPGMLAGGLALAFMVSQDLS